MCTNCVDANETHYHVNKSSIVFRGFIVLSIKQQRDCNVKCVNCISTYKESIPYAMQKIFLYILLLELIVPFYSFRVYFVFIFLFVLY